ncbi:MAG: hypothetical protein ACUVXI_16125 [bacterium]
MIGRISKGHGALYDHRIFYPTLADEAKLESILKWLSEVPAYSLMMFNGSFDGDPAILTLEEHERRAHRLSEIVPKVSEMGIIPAINVLATMGHGNKKAPIKEKFGFQPIVGSDGIEVDGAVCALDEKFLEYVYRMYRTYAQTGAQHIWTDDDVRISHHGQKSEFCFCPLHIKRISDETGRRWKREKLVEALSDTNNKGLHKIWYEINSNEIIELFKRVERAVHEVNPNIRIGMMTCGHNSSRKIDEEIRALRGDGAAPLLRPGGMYWDDEPLLGAMRKRILIRSEMPIVETDFETSYELENHPYWPPLKSIEAMKIEMDLNFADGIDRIALNIFDNVGGPIDEIGRYKNLLRSRHNFHISIKESIAGKKICGVNTIRSPYHFHNTAFRAWGENLARIGIPTVSATGNLPAILCGRICEAMDDSELASIISGGAIIDGTSFKDLIVRRILDSGDIDISDREIDIRDIAYERFTDDPINGRYAGEPQQVWGISNLIGLAIKNRERFLTLSEWIGIDGDVISPSSIVYNSSVPSLIFPYSVSANSLLTERRAHQIGCFLSKIPEYEGVWAKDLNCFPILYKGDGEVVLGISRFSLDPIESFTLWLSPKLGEPKDKVLALNDSGKWEKAKFLLTKDSALNAGSCLEIKRSGKPMSVNVFKWAI